MRLEDYDTVIVATKADITKAKRSIILSNVVAMAIFSMVVIALVRC